jgi:hypothetical protein
MSAAEETVSQGSFCLPSVCSLQIQSVSSGRNYDMMFRFIIATKFCSGGAVRWEDNVQDVRDKGHELFCIGWY